MIALFLSAFLGPALAADGPEISRDTGNEGEVVVLWPRIVPATEDPQLIALGREVQTLLADLTTTLGRSPNVRPMPERACPRAGGGCQVPTASALIAHHEGGCAVVGLIGATGEGGTESIGWVGHVQVRQRIVPFREPPENGVRVVDFVPCDEVAAALPERRDVLTDALRSALAE